MDTGEVLVLTSYNGRFLPGSVSRRLMDVYYSDRRVRPKAKRTHSYTIPRRITYFEADNYVTRAREGPLASERDDIGSAEHADGVVQFLRGLGWEPTQEKIDRLKEVLRRREEDDRSREG